VPIHCCRLTAPAQFCIEPAADTFLQLQLGADPEPDMVTEAHRCRIETPWRCWRHRHPEARSGRPHRGPQEMQPPRHRPAGRPALPASHPAWGPPAAWALPAAMALQDWRSRRRRCGRRQLLCRVRRRARRGHATRCRSVVLCGARAGRRGVTAAAPRSCLRRATWRSRRRPPLPEAPDGMSQQRQSPTLRATCCAAGGWTAAPQTMSLAARRPGLYLHTSWRLYYGTANCMLGLDRVRELHMSTQRHAGRRFHLRSSTTWFKREQNGHSAGAQR